MSYFFTPPNYWEYAKCPTDIGSVQNPQNRTLTSPERIIAGNCNLWNAYIWQNIGTIPSSSQA